MKRALLLSLSVLAIASCFDPLYESGDPLTSGWVLCCPGGAIDTCFCDSPEALTCRASVFPCANGTCSASPTCGAGGGSAGGGTATGGGSTTMDAGSAGGGTSTGGGGGAGAGGGADGGVVTDAGSSDAGAIDAGSQYDGGIGGGGGSMEDAGSPIGGGTATGGGGGSMPTRFEFCCASGRVTTCACPASGCVNAPFTPCPGGSCVDGTSTALCR